MWSLSALALSDFFTFVSESNAPWTAPCVENLSSAEAKSFKPAGNGFSSGL